MHRVWAAVKQLCSRPLSVEGKYKIMQIHENKSGQEHPDASCWAAVKLLYPRPLSVEGKYKIMQIHENKSGQEHPDASCLAAVKQHASVSHLSRVQTK